MNLLTDPWIPVREEGVFRHLRLRELLCSEGDRRLSLPRDDMEMTALQMIVCLVQVIFMPADADELKMHIASPMDEADYDTAVEPFVEWFDLVHPDHPFMQVRGVKAQHITGIQKLFVGLPEGSGHTFFNTASEVTKACASCTAIAIFNQASNSPSFGGGFKEGLRGGTPVTTLVVGDSLRETIWFNVLNKEYIVTLLPWIHDVKDMPVWVQPIESGKDIPVYDIGLLRGLFWQPVHVELDSSYGMGRCDVCASKELSLYGGFKKEKFRFNVIGIWPHPHSPRYWNVKGGDRKERFLSFTTVAPTWTKLNEILVWNVSDKEGHIPAPVLDHYCKVFAPGRWLHLSVGGYRNKQASILQRRHDFFSLAGGWDGALDKLYRLITTGLEIKEILHKKLYRFGKELESDILAKALSWRGSEAFYYRSEPIVHRTLREMDWRKAVEVQAAFKKEMTGIARNIFEETTRPYSHDPKMLAVVALCRRSLELDFQKIDR